MFVDQHESACLFRCYKRFCEFNAEHSWFGLVIPLGNIELIEKKPFLVVEIRFFVLNILNYTDFHVFLYFPKHLQIRVLLIVKKSLWNFLVQFSHFLHFDIVKYALTFVFLNKIKIFHELKAFPTIFQNKKLSFKQTVLQTLLKKFLKIIGLNINNIWVYIKVHWGCFDQRFFPRGLRPGN